jgi:hypothetical protein
MVISQKLLLNLLRSNGAGAIPRDMFFFESRKKNSPLATDIGQSADEKG